MLRDKIIELICSQREGEYWDFKEEPHANNAMLLHDILSMSNSLCKGERYLIFGVTDLANGCKIKGLTPSQINRKSQADYIDFIRGQKFAGDYRPVVELKTIEIDGFEIDVLIIFDLPYKPYYITAPYRYRDKEVRANHIYLRNYDTNTPSDKSADIHLIEKMWYQRFGLDLTPLEKMKQYLNNPEYWTKDIGNNDIAFHNNFPEYTIDLSEVEEFWEVYSYFFTNEKSFLGTAKFKYHQTELFKLEYMYCDEMRITLPVPQTEYMCIDNEDNWYYYYEKTSIVGLFLYFLTDGSYNLLSRGTGAPFLLFRDEEARNNFNKYLLENSIKLGSMEPTFWGMDALKRMAQSGNRSVVDPLFLDKINQLYEVWIKN